MRWLAPLLCALWLALPARAAEIKLATWNIAWLTLRPTGDPDLPRDIRARTADDFRLIRHYANQINADIVALQEIDGEQAAARVFDASNYAIHLTSEADIQRPGFAIRRTLRFTRNPDLAELDIRPQARFSLRRGADITVQIGETQRLRLLSVHLNAGCREEPLTDNAPRECESLARQARILARWVEARRHEGIPFAILGDFNRRMPRADDFMRIVDGEETLLRPTAGFASPCWADARGGQAFVDHILLGGAAAQWYVAGSMAVRVYAERDRGFRQRLSDHCPVSVRLNVP
jgi:endonuclease/exonuclease/phosphatase family metal-dependent hydrolase